LSSTAAEIRVRSLADLASLVSHPEPEYRAAAYSSIIADPDKALALASDDTGRDVVDLLVDAYTRTRSNQEKVPLLNVLGQFADSRVDTLFRNLLRFETSDELLHLAARYVDESGLEMDRPFWLALLRDDSSLARVRIAAARISESPPMEAANQIRIAAFADERLEFPALTPETISAWQRELEGPFGEYLLLRLQHHGPDIADWARVWDLIQPWLRHWLVRIACSRSPAVETIIRLGIESDDSDTVAATVAALQLYRPSLSDEMAGRLAESSRVRR
jgi:hypothetical protein